MAESPPGKTENPGSDSESGKFCFSVMKIKFIGRPYYLISNKKNTLLFD